MELCPRCIGGKLFAISEIDGDYLECINCGYHQETKRRSYYTYGHNGASCPYCFGHNVIKMGHNSGRQRYWCKDCGQRPLLTFPADLIKDTLKLLGARTAHRHIMMEVKRKYDVVLPKPMLEMWGEKVNGKGLVAAGKR